MYHLFEYFKVLAKIICISDPTADSSSVVLSPTKNKLNIMKTRNVLAKKKTAVLAWDHACVACGGVGGKVKTKAGHRARKNSK
jgi:hypothetical protein